MGNCNCTGACNTTGKCDGRLGCAKLDSKGDCGCSNDANQSKQERIAKEHLLRYNEWLERSSEMEPNAKVEFCKHCGASIPHRHGEGRCIECFHHAPREEWGNFEKFVRRGECNYGLDCCIGPRTCRLPELEALVAVECSDRDGRVPLQEPVLGTEVLRSTLEALERLLGQYYYQNGRRAIRDMVQGPLNYWLRDYNGAARWDSRDELAIPTAFWVALQEWVEHGVSAQEQLSRTLRQFIDALDSTRNKGAK